MSMSEGLPVLAQECLSLVSRFEAALPSGTGVTAIENCLADAREADRPSLFQHLLLAQLLRRQHQGEDPTPDDYRPHFPPFADLIDRVFALSAAGTTVDPQTPSSRRIAGSMAPPRVPGYEILGELGRGGMGVVYKARQLRLQRLTALKMLRSADLAGPTELERFQAEAKALARLQNPHIVQVFELGEHEGKPFIVLEFCPAGSLAAHLKTAVLNDRQRAGLVEMLARAVAGAHRVGLIHRDLKPANVLLAADPLGSVPQAVQPPPLPGLVPKITDFGLAKLLDSDNGQTRSGQVMGTPAYMAPEQASGRVQEVGPAADVWALGVILYELLTGRVPFKGATVQETLQRISTEEPERPSQLRKGVPADLETICLKCLEKEPWDRYHSAQALADDLHRFRMGEPIKARRSTGRLELLVKWARRQPLAAALVGVSLLSLLAVVGVAVSLVYSGWLQDALTEARQQKENAEKQKALAEEQKTIAETARGEADAERIKARAAEGEATHQRAEAQKQWERAEQLLYVSNLRNAHRAWVMNDLAAALSRLEECRADLRGWEYDYVHRLCIGSRFTLKEHTNGVSSVAFSPDGKRLVSGGEGQTLTVWDADKGTEVMTLKGHLHFVRSVAYSPDGKRLASASDDQTVKVWDADKGTTVLTLKGHTRQVKSVAFSPDGKRLASASLDQTVKVWDATTGQEIHSLNGHAHVVLCVCFSPDGKRLVSASSDKTLKVWDANTGRELRTLRGHTSTVQCVCFSPDGKRLVSGGGDPVNKLKPGELKLWDATTLQEPFPLEDHAGPVYSVCFSPDGRRLASGGEDNVVRIEEVPLDLAEALVTHRKDLAARHEALAKASLTWHRTEAASSEQAGQWFAVAFHLDQLLRAEPDDGSLYLRRGVALARSGDPEAAQRYLAWARDRKVDLASAYLPLGDAYAERGQWGEAAAAFARAVEDPRAPVLVWYKHALLCLQGGDRKGYRRACATILERFRDTTDPGDSFRVTWVCVQAPQAVDDLELPVGLAEKAVAKALRGNSAGICLGALLVRTGKPETGLLHLEEDVKRGAALETKLFLALAHHQLGHADEAKQWLKKAPPLATGTTNDPWETRLSYALLRREVESTLKATQPEKPTDPPRAKKDNP